MTTATVRNTLAFVAFFGNYPRGCHMATRLATQRYEDGYVWLRFNHTFAFASETSASGYLQFYSLTEAAAELVADRALTKALAWLKAEGFCYDRSRRMPKARYIPGFRHPDTGQELWISRHGATARVYCGSNVQFEAKDGE